MATQKEEILITLDFDTSPSIKAAADLNKSIAVLNKSQKELKKQNQEGSVEFANNAAALRENKKELSATNKTIDNLTKANKSNAGSNEQLKAQLSLQTAEYNKLSKVQKTSTEEGKALGAQVKSTSDELKENEEAVGDNTRSVGDYGGALSSTPFGGFISGLKSMGAAALANPLLLVITLIVGAFALLKKAFESSEEGQNSLAKGTAILGSIFDNIIDVVSKLATFIVSLFENPKQSLKDFAKLIKDNIVNRFNGLLELIPSLGKAISALFKGNFAEAGKIAANAVAKVTLGVDDLTGKIGKAGEALSKFASEARSDAERAAAIADKRAKADVLERDLIVSKSKIEAQIADARQKSNDLENFSAKERQDALKEAARLVGVLADQEEERAQLLFDALKEENTLANSNKDAKKAEAEAEAALFNVQRARSESLKSLQRDELRVNNEIKKASQDRVKAAEAAVNKAIQQSKTEIDLFIAQQGTRAKSLEDEIALAEEVSAKKLAILQRELDAKLISETEFEIESIAIKEESLLLQTQLVIDNADRELDAIVEANQSKLDANQFLNDELAIQEQDRISIQAEARRAFEATRLAEGVITEQEFNDAIKSINEEAQTSTDELNSAKKQADEEQAIADLQNQRAIDIQNGADRFELRQTDLDARRAQEIANAEATGADISLINEKFDNLDISLNEQKNAAKLQLAQGALSNVITITGKESAVGRAAAIAQTTIDTFQAAQAAFKSLVGIPVVGPGLGALAASAAIVSGLKNVKSIAATKAEKGGIFGGKSHSQGGTKGYFDDGTQIEVEKGELFAVVNKTNTAMLSNLSAINQHGGNGDAFFKGGGVKSFLQDGGIGLANVSTSVESDVDSANQILTAIENLPAPVVIVQDINSVQEDTNIVEVRSEI